MARRPADREFEFTDKEFKVLVGIIYDNTGIVLKDTKFDMLYGRISRRLRSLGMRGAGEYLDFLRGPNSDAELGLLVNAVTTNLTRFFRESHHFSHLRNEVLKPAIMDARSGKRKGRELNIWCSAASTGEEPYSISMVTRASVPTRESWKIRILASDIDTSVLAKGKEGVYPENAFENVPRPLVRKFTRKVPGSDNLSMTDDVRELLDFRQINLLKTWPAMEPLDVIFCRNVLIYFDRKTQEKIVSQFITRLKPGGILYLGHAESLAAEGQNLAGCGKSIFQRAGG